MFLLIGIANEQNPRIMTSSNFGLKIATKTQNCRRKLNLVSKGAKSQVNSENIYYVNIFSIDIMTSSNFVLKIAKKSKLSQRAKISLKRCTI